MTTAKSKLRDFKKSDLPVDPRETHVFHIAVSKGGSQHHVRKATVQTVHGADHALSVALKHYKSQGFDVHDHKIVKEETQIDELSNATLQSYKDKAMKSSDELTAQGKHKEANDRLMNHMKASGKQISKTMSNIRKALHKEGYHDNRTGFARRHREDDEYHTPDPVTTTHKIVHRVSHPDVNGGAEHNREVTISNTTKTREQAKAAAKTHLQSKGFKIHEEVVNEGAYEKAEENKKSADAAKKQGDMFAHHLHMADHHDNLAQWHSEKGRHGEADRHAEKAEEHHEKAMTFKEEVAANSVSSNGVAGLKGDAGKKAVMTNPVLRRKTFKQFKEECTCWKGYKRKPGTKPCEKGSCVKEDNQIDEAAIDAKGHKSSTGGLTQKGVDAYNRENPGHHLQTAVTTPPSKLDPDSKAAKRRKSFCARMSGVDGPMKDEKGRPTRKALALRKWNC